MLRKQLELPPDVAKTFVKNMRAFFKAKDQLAGDKIAADTGWMLKQHLPKGAKLRLQHTEKLRRSARRSSLQLRCLRVTMLLPLREILNKLGALMRASSLGSLIFLLFGSVALAQGNIPGAPSKAGPRIGVDVTEIAEDKADRIQNIFENIDLVSNFLRERQVQNTLVEYLTNMGAKPAAGEVHVFYVRALQDGNGNIELQNYQYLASGRSSEDALRESFAVSGNPSEPQLDSVPRGKQLVGIYVQASSENGEFVVRGGSLSKESLEKYRKEGADLREARRIAKVRQEQAAIHRAGHDPAVRNAQKPMAPHRSGVEISSTSPVASSPSAAPPPSIAPPTRTDNVTKQPFAAHKPISFEAPVPKNPQPGPSPSNEGPELIRQ